MSEDDFLDRIERRLLSEPHMLRWSDSNWWQPVGDMHPMPKKFSHGAHAELRLRNGQLVTVRPKGQLGGSST